MPRLPDASKKHLALRLLLLVAMLVGFGLYFYRHPEKIPDPSAIEWHYFSWIILLSAFANLAAAFAYHCIIWQTQEELTRFEIVRIFIISRSMNLISPQGGTLYAAMTLKNGAGLSYTKYSAGSTACLWLDLTLASATASIALSFTQASVQRSSLLTIFIGCCGCSLIGVSVLRRLQRSQYLERATRIPDRIHTKLLEFTSTVNQLLSHRRLCFEFGAWSLVNTSIHALRLWLCFAMVEQWISLPNAFTTTILVKASNTVAITPGNLGIAESIVGFMGTKFGLSVGAAVLAGVVYRFSTYIALLGMSSMLIVWKSIRPNK